MTGPLLLRSDNFTPPERTPWGGTRILGRYKRHLPLDPHRAEYPVVGESWEVSVEPDFPSRLQETGELLSEVIARSPEAMVGAEAAAAGGCTLLVKLLDAADDLSVQIHPANDFAGLGPAESGKPESWYVLAADPGAGLYLGLRQGVDERELCSAVEAAADVSALLFFVPVTEGDFFLIDAGTPHAVGRGITLVEPQRVLPGRRGVTYRYWDWNRRYDSAGRPAPKGTPRPLHLAEALAVTDWEGPREAALLERIRYRGEAPNLTGPPQVTRLAGPEAPVVSPILEVARLCGSGTLKVEPQARLRALTVVGGTIRLHANGTSIELRCGQSAVLPASMPPATAEMDAAHAILCSASA
jgi:mannose-6-phosphate isomerase class I